jgi:hypothetical protein
MILLGRSGNGVAFIVAMISCAHHGPNNKEESFSVQPVESSPAPEGEESMSNDFLDALHQMPDAGHSNQIKLSSEALALVQDGEILHVDAEDTTFSNGDFERLELAGEWTIAWQHAEAMPAQFTLEDGGLVLISDGRKRYIGGFVEDGKALVLEYKSPDDQVPAMRVCLNLIVNSFGSIEGWGQVWSGDEGEPEPVLLAREG